MDAALWQNSRMDYSGGGCVLGGSPFEMNKNKSHMNTAPDSLVVFNCTISHAAFVWAGSQLNHQVQRLLMGTDAILAEADSVAVPRGCSLARPCLTCSHHPHE